MRRRWEPVRVTEAAGLVELKERLVLRRRVACELFGSPVRLRFDLGLTRRAHPGAALLPSRATDICFSDVRAGAGDLRVGEHGHEARVKLVWARH